MKSNNQNDEEPPKPTADVLMSRNLRGGAQKGFDFAFGSDDDDSPSPSPQKDHSVAEGNQDEGDDSDQNEEEGQQKQSFSQKGGLNLLLHKGQQNRKIGGLGAGLKSKKPGELSVGWEDDSSEPAPVPAKRNKFKPMTIVTDDDGINFSKGNDSKFDEIEESRRGQ